MTAPRFSNPSGDQTPGGVFLLAGVLPIHRLGFGAMRITGPDVLGPPADRKEAVRVVRRALELGVNFIDTADSYGPNVSEEIIAEALHPYPAGLVIATKGGRWRDGNRRPWPIDGRPEYLKKACVASLRRLRLDCIDLYQLHRPDEHVPFEDSVGALAELRAEGKIRHVGLSGVSVAQLDAAQAIVPIASVQNRYNAKDRSSEDVLRACEARGLAFMPYAPLLHNDDAVGRVLDEVASVRGGVTARQVSLAWLLARSPVTVPIPGTGSVAHLEENMVAAELTLQPDEMAAIDEAAGA